jgi:hypothetical protein
MTWLVAALVWLPSADAELSKALEQLRAVDKLAKGNRDATAAWRIVAAAPADGALDVLAAFDGAGPLAANYLTSAFGALVQKHGKSISTEAVEKFLRDSKRSPIARRLAYEFLIDAKPGRKSALLDDMLNDPSVEIRRDAVAQVLERATSASKSDKKAAETHFRSALEYGRDQDQVEKAAASLRELGIPVDVARQFGFIQQWKLIGPFENAGDKGWPVAYPPETEIDFAKEYDGKVGKVKWIEHASDDDLGEVDLNKVYPKRYKGAITYAYAEFVAPQEMAAEVRLGSIVAWKAWVNGKLAFERNESHSGEAVDQYTIPVKLQAGKNALLFKFCQNEQTQPWAQNWNFRVRMSDEVGTALLSADRPPAKPTLGKPKASPEPPPEQQPKPAEKKKAVGKA